jgi:recombination protein RecA
MGRAKKKTKEDEPADEEVVDEVETQDDPKEEVVAVAKPNNQYQVTKDFDKTNDKIQNQINALLNKEGINVDFLDDTKTVQDFIDTGNLAFNFAISGRFDGGWPVGRISELAGDPSTGKTLLATIAAVKALIKGYMVYYIDSEQAYDANFAKLIAKTLGQSEEIVRRINYIEVDKIEELTSTVTKILDVFEKNKVSSGALIVLDSIAFLSTNKEEADVMAGEDKVDMTKAKKLRQFVRVVKNKVKNMNIAMLMTNQLTFNIGASYGAPPKTTSGGTAVPYATSVRVSLTSSKDFKEGNKEKLDGIIIRGRVTKSRLTTPFKRAEMSIKFDGRFSKWSGLLQLLVEQEIIKKKEGGRTYTYGDVEFTTKTFVENVCRNKENFDKLIHAVELSKVNDSPSSDDDDIEIGDEEKGMSADEI